MALINFAESGKLVRGSILDVEGKIVAIKSGVVLNKSRIFAVLPVLTLSGGLVSVSPFSRASSSFSVN